MTNDMWDRFFRGSKYEDKWLKRGKTAAKSERDDFSLWLARMQAMRDAMPPSAPSKNPFGESEDE